MELVHNNKHSSTLVSSWFSKLGSVAGPVIQANGRLEELEDGFEKNANTLNVRNDGKTWNAMQLKRITSPNQSHAYADLE